MTVFELVQRNIDLGWNLILYVSFILAAITVACNSSLGKVYNCSVNDASLDFADIKMVVTLLLLTYLKKAASLYDNDDAFVKVWSSI